MAPLHTGPMRDSQLDGRLSTRARALLTVLADGCFHSGVELADSQAISRTSVWKQLRGLRRLGIDLQAVPGRGYRVSGGIDLLVAETVRRSLGDLADKLGELRVLDTVDSTSSEVRRRARAGVPSPIVCLAEFQSAGRGRRGRSWMSAFGAGIWLSVLLELQLAPGLLGKLSLVAGVALGRSLRELGVSSLGLKWPNDILVGDQKLGGVLVEYEGESRGRGVLVLGVGINTVLPAGANPGDGYPTTDLARAMEPVQLPQRSRLAGELTASLLNAIDAYGRGGWRRFADDWASLDVLSGRDVAVALPGGDRIFGRALGIDTDGAMRVQTASGELRCLAGEVSLRTCR